MNGLEMAAAKSMDVVTFKKLLMDTEDYVVIRRKKSLAMTKVLWP